MPQSFLWFASYAREFGLASAYDLKAFSHAWLAEYNRGTEGFGEEETFEDWHDGFKCWQTLFTIAGAIERQQQSLPEWRS